MAAKHRMTTARGKTVENGAHCAQVGCTWDPPESKNVRAAARRHAEQTGHAVTVWLGYAVHYMPEETSQ